MTVHLLAVHLVTGLPLCCGRTAPKFSEEEGSYASCFYCWFLESFKSCLLLPMALPSLIDTLVQLLAWRSMLWLSMTMCVAAKVLDTEWFPQHAQHGLLAWSLALHLFCFSQEKPAFMVKGNTRTQTHTHTVQKQLCFATLYKSHWDGCSPVNLLHIFRTTFPKNTSGWLLLIQAT